MRTWLRPLTLTIAAVLVVLAAAGITAACDGGTLGSSIAIGNASSSGPGGHPGGSKAPAPVCERLFVPAYFSAPYWETTIQSKHKPEDLILDVDGTGAGSAPDPGLQRLVKQAQAAGITVLGYSSTANGQRSAGQVEADVRHYAAWYGVTSIFLDRVSGTAQMFPYYSQLSRYIHAAHKGAQVWMNPGVYPDDQNYMSIGDVVMAFEGTYAQYLTTPVPGWAMRYPAARFAHTIYATPAPALNPALRLAQQRNAGHVFVTDLVGSNPYQGLPSYWATEGTAAAAGCPGAG